MKTKLFFITVSLFCLILISCESEKNKINDKKFSNVSLRQEWFPYSGYAGEVYAVYETSKHNNINIILEQGSDNIDPIKLVLSGKNDFGVVSSDRILLSEEKGAELVVIGVVNYISPTCFIAKNNSNINSPKDFEGKRIGILTGTNTELIYKTLKSKFNLQNVNEVEIPFDLATFITGNYDVRPAFIYDEPVSLDLKNIKHIIINPSDFGVDFLGTVYFARKDFVKNNPEIVQNFVNAISEGWKMALENPEKAIGLLKKYDSTIDTNRELLSLKKGLNYFKGENDKLLFASKERWVRMANYLQDLGMLKKFNFEETVNNSFVNNYNALK